MTITPEVLQEQIANLARQRDNAMEVAAAARGAIQLCEYLLTILEKGVSAEPLGERQPERGAEDVAP